MSLQGFYGTNPGETMTLNDPSQGIWGGYTVTTQNTGRIGRGRSQNSGYSALLQSLQKSEAKAKKATEERYKQAMSKMKAIESIYSPGGSFGKGYAAYLAGQTEDILASQEQGLISSGLWSTTKKEGLKTVAGKREAEAMGEFQRKQMGGYAQALAGTAGLIERREDTSMDYGLIAQLMAKATA